MMALDVGEVRMGVAISDPLHLIAQPFGFLAAGNRKKCLEEVARIVLERKVGRIVVGHPTSMQGRRTQSTEKAEDFAQALRKRLPDVPVELWDERLTTVEALSVLREGNVKGKKQRQKVDQVAAALILQSYLDHHRPLGA